jgi:hypothetical protein
LIKIVSLVKTSGKQFTKVAKLTILNNRFDSTYFLGFPPLFSQEQQLEDAV